VEAYFWTVWTGQPHEPARADMPTPEAMQVTSDAATPLSDGLRRACGRLLKALLERPAIAALALPQPPSAHAYYYDVIKHPRDLQGILSNLESYQTLAVRAMGDARRRRGVGVARLTLFLLRHELVRGPPTLTCARLQDIERDVRLAIANARYFNPALSSYHAAADDLERRFNQAWPPKEAPRTVALLTAGGQGMGGLISSEHLALPACCCSLLQASPPPQPRPQPPPPPLQAPPAPAPATPAPTAAPTPAPAAAPTPAPAVATAPAPPKLPAIKVCGRLQVSPAPRAVALTHDGAPQGRPPDTSVEVG